MKQLLARTGRADITPAPGIPQGIWGAQTHQRGIGAAMPLYATALTLSVAERTIAIIDVDSVGFDTEWVARITGRITELTGLERDAICLSTTHTHSGPNTLRLATISEGLGMIHRYLDGLPDRIAGTAWQNQLFTPDYPGDFVVARWLGRQLGLEASKVALGIDPLPRRERFTGVLPSGAPIALYEDEPVTDQAPLLRIRSRTAKLPVADSPAPETAEREAEQTGAELNRLRKQRGRQKDTGGLGASGAVGMARRQRPLVSRQANRPLATIGHPHR